MLLLAQSNNTGRAIRGDRSDPSWRRATSGFSLVELLLVVGLLLLFASAMVFNFSGLLRGHQLEEGTTRLETLMRFARAQAANSGHKVQLVFNSESTNTPAASTGEVRATWEPDPKYEVSVRSRKVADAFLVEVAEVIRWTDGRC